MAGATISRARAFLARRALAASWLLYDALVSTVVWGVLVPTGLIDVARRRWPAGELFERMGRTRFAMPGRQRIVVHAVSAGEAAAASALIRALRERLPDYSVLFTVGNADGRAIAMRLQQQMPAIEAVVPLPWDRYSAVQRWLGNCNASAVVVVEPEIWPNLYRACRRLGVPLFLVNSRLTARDVRRYRRARWFFADVLRVPQWIGAQSVAEKRHLVAIGAAAERIEVTGSVKFDVALNAAGGPALRAFVNARPAGRLIVAGSTHPPEEELLLRAFEQLRHRFTDLRLVLAPRHVTRAVSLGRRLAARGHRVVQASRPGRQSWDVLVVDRLGELASLYATADVSFIGGTLIPRGGHNVLEAAARGCATIVGPHTENISAVVDGLLTVGGVVQIGEPTVTALTAAFASLLGNVDSREQIGQRARAYCTQHAGAAARSADAIVDRLPAAVRLVSANDRTRARRARWPRAASDPES